MEDSLLGNVYFWSGASLVAFLGLAVWKGRKPVVSWLDGEIVKVREELERARKLRAEAEAMLIEYRQKQAAAMEEARQILDYARQEAEDLRVAAEAELKETMARREQQAKDRISLAEAEAVAEIRNTAIDLAVRASEQILREQMDAAQAARLIDQAIDEIPALVGQKVSQAA